MSDYLTRFTLAYVECAMWADLRDEDGESIDADCTIDDLAPESFLNVLHTCADFVWSNLDDLQQVATLHARDEWSAAEQAGRDFWLSRNHHGSGFWDHGYGAIGDRLHKASDPYGSSYPYVGDDGQVWLDQ